MRTGFFPLLCCSLFTSGWKLVLLYVQGHYLERFCPQKHTVGNYSPWLRWGRYIFCCSRAENLLVVLTSDVPSSKWQKRHLSRWRNLVGQDPSRQYGSEKPDHRRPVTVDLHPIRACCTCRSCSTELPTGAPNGGLSYLPPSFSGSRGRRLNIDWRCYWSDCRGWNYWPHMRFSHSSWFESFLVMTI